MQLGFVFTNFNNSKYTLEAVRSLARSEAWGQCAVCVVDNASIEPEQAILRSLLKDYPTVNVIFNKVNAGYFPGLNIGIDAVRSLHPKIEMIFVGNNDLEFPSNIMEQVNACKSLLEQYPVLSPDIVTLDGIHQNPHVLHPISRLRRTAWSLYYANYFLGMGIRLIARWTRRFTRMKDADHHETPGLVDQGFGACYLLGPIFFRHFQKLWAPTFLMHEEYFFSLQLESKNYKVFYTPAIQIKHHWHASVGKIPGRKIWELSRDAYRLTLKYQKYPGE